MKADIFISIYMCLNRMSTPFGGLFDKCLKKDRLKAYFLPISKISSGEMCYIQRSSLVIFSYLMRPHCRLFAVLYLTCPQTQHNNVILELDEHLDNYQSYMPPQKKKLVLMFCKQTKRYSQECGPHNDGSLSNVDCCVFSFVKYYF